MRKILIIGLSGLVLLACNRPNAEYQEQLELGLSSGDRYDSLFLTLHLGMTDKDFYTRCWELNSQGLIMQGPGNLSVEYDLENNELKYPAYMRFYPQFHDSEIYNMPVEITYQSAMPTDKSRSAEMLIQDVKQLMERWYGDGFIYLEDDDSNRRVYVKVDGNRRIRIFKKDLVTVAVELTDMPVHLALNANENE